MLVLGVSLSVLPAAAQTEVDGRVSSIEVATGTVSMTFTGSNLPEGTVIDPDSVEVTLDGEPMQSEAVPIIESVEPPLRTVVLVIDTSSSMARDGKIDGAKSAALAFLDQVPDDVLVGLVPFAGNPVVRVEPTTQRQAVRRAINRLRAGGDTSLYDAVLLAAQATGTQGDRQTIILSDGQDSTSEATLEEAVAGVTDARVRADAIAVGAGAEGALASLAAITAATDGVVVQVEDAADLAAFFEVAAEQLTNELAVTSTIPEDFDSSSATLEVRGLAGDQTVAASAFITVEPVSTTEPLATQENNGPIAVPPPALLLPESAGWVLPAALVGIGLGIFGVVGLALLRLVHDGTVPVRSRLSLYTLTGKQPVKQQEITSTALGESHVARSAVALADRVVQRRHYEDDLAQRLDAAGLPLRPAEWVLIHAGIAVGAGLFALLVTDFNAFVAVVALLLGVLAPYLYLNIKASRRRDRFVSQLPDTLQLMAGSMEVGYSLPQAVDTVVREDLDPVSSEFSRALIESRLGVPIEDALETVGGRMQSQDFDWVVMAIRIQRQVGGSLAEVLKTVADTLREREQLRRTVRALSADGRLSAWIVGLAPFFVAMFLMIFNPGYIRPLFQDPLGLVMLGAAAILIVVGVLLITRIVKVEI